MEQEDRNTLHNYVQNQINDLPITINEELYYKNKKFNYRNDFNIITGHIDDFLEGDNINRYLVLPSLGGVGKTTILYQTYDIF